MNNLDAELANVYVQRILKEVEDLIKAKLANEAKVQFLETIVNSQNEAVEKFRVEHEELLKKCEELEKKEQDLKDEVIMLREESNTIRTELAEARNNLYKEIEAKKLADATKNVALAMEQVPAKKKKNTPSLHSV